MGRGASEARRSAELTPLTSSELTGHHKERHVRAKGLAIGATIAYRLNPLMDRVADWELSRVKTADIEDFIADLRKRAW